VKTSEKVNQSAIKPETAPTTPQSIAGTEVKPLPDKAQETAPAAQETTLEVLPPVQYLALPGNKIALETINARLHKAACNAGRMSSEAKRLGIGRIAKDMSGGGTLIPTLACLSDLESLGKLGDTKADIKARKDEIRALNMIVDGFALLGLAKRREV
jgi:hypothetical protein